MPDFVFRDVRAFYQVWGDGTPIVILHSGGSSSAQWTKTAEHLPSHRIIAPDCLGFGATAEWPESGASNRFVRWRRASIKLWLRVNESTS